MLDRLIKISQSGKRSGATSDSEVKWTDDSGDLYKTDLNFRLFNASKATVREIEFFSQEKDYHIASGKNCKILLLTKMH